MNSRLFLVIVVVVVATGCAKKGDVNGGADPDPNRTYTLTNYTERAGDRFKVVQTSIRSAESVVSGKFETVGSELHLEFDERVERVPSDRDGERRVRTYKKATRTDVADKTSRTLSIEGKAVEFETKSNRNEATSGGAKLSGVDGILLRLAYSNEYRDSHAGVLSSRPVKINEEWAIPADALGALADKGPYLSNRATNRGTGKLLRAEMRDGRLWGTVALEIDFDVDPKSNTIPDGEWSGVVKVSITFEGVLDGSSRDGTLRVVKKSDVSSPPRGARAEPDSAKSTYEQTTTVKTVQ